MNAEDQHAWMDEENKSHATEESIKQTHTHLKCNYKHSGHSCRIMDANSCYYCKIFQGITAQFGIRRRPQAQLRGVARINKDVRRRKIWKRSRFARSFLLFSRP